MQEKWQCRWAPSLGKLEKTHHEVWGTDDHTDLVRPTVFFGVYGFPDFFTLWRHQGRKAILWAGTDITHFRNGYWLEDGGSIKLDFRSLAEWINKNCESYVENEVERKALEDVGIDSIIRPSFLGNIDDFPISYKSSDKPKVYSSVSGNNFALYGWHKIDKMAKENPGIEFHLYGNTESWKSSQSNVIVHGRVSQERMNQEIKDMQGALRLNEFDGFSEVVAKSILMGQYPISEIPYKYVLKPSEISKLHDYKYPNIVGRDYYRKVINNFPWNSNLKCDKM